MASNPLVSQGLLNKLSGTVQVVDFPQLNAISSNLGDDGISLAFEGEASGYFGTMTGAVPSPNPYQMATATIHLLKTQSLSNLWERQRLNNTTIGDIVITTDARSTLNSYTLSNCTIKNVNELSFAGKEPGYVVTVGGTYFINGDLFSQQ